jgi:pimeloyl-ACP methyl ester carboxylesterase
MLHYRTYRREEASDWVVFIHGAGGSSAVWYKQIQAYARHFNLLLIDLRGHGNSADGPALNRYEYSFESIALDVAEVLEHLEIEKAHFVGVSLGTIVIRKFAEMRSEYVLSMIMVGAITEMNLKSRFLVRIGNMFRHVMPPMWLYRLFAFIIMPLGQASESRNVFIREAQKLAKKEFIRWFKLTHRMTAKLRKMEENDVGIPILYVMGEYDHLFLEPIRQRVSKFTNQSLAVVEKCGHVVNIEKAGQFNDLSISFIRELQVDKIGEDPESSLAS